MSTVDVIAALIGGVLGWVVGDAMNGLHSLRRASGRGFIDEPRPQLRRARERLDGSVAPIDGPTLWPEADDRVNGGPDATRAGQEAGATRRSVAV